MELFGELKREIASKKIVSSCLIQGEEKKRSKIEICFELISGTCVRVSWSEFLFHFIWFFLLKNALHQCLLLISLMRLLRSHTLMLVIHTVCVCARVCIGKTICISLCVVWLLIRYDWLKTDFFPHFLAFPLADVHSVKRGRFSFANIRWMIRFSLKYCICVRMVSYTRMACCKKVAFISAWTVENRYQFEKWLQASNVSP